MSNVLLRNTNLAYKSCSPVVTINQHALLLRPMSSVPSKRNSDFSPRIINKNSFPDIEIQKLRRGTGGRSSFNGMIVTIFGSTGFLARAVANHLGSIGTQLICPYRGDHYKARNLKLAGDLGQVLYVPFSIRDTDSIYRAMKHSNVVINLIGKDNETGNFDFKSVHVEGARTIARIARESGIKRLIHVSALNSSPKPEPHYVKGGSGFLRSKYEGELAVREEFPEATIFRPADIYGENDRFLFYYCMFHRRSIRNLSLPYGGYGITKTPVALTDVARGIVNSVTDEDSIGKTYDAVGPRRYELRELLEYLNDIIEKHPDEGFKISNLRWDPLMKMRISFLSQFKSIFKYPVVHWEKIERECISDEKPRNPTLMDLGIRLSYIEDTWPHALHLWRWNCSYDGDLGEKKLYTHPPFIPDN